MLPMSIAVPVSRRKPGDKKLRISGAREYFSFGTYATSSSNGR